MSQDAGGNGRRGLYPAIEPFESGLMDVGDGHQVYWERCGVPGGAPAVFLHGGPGAGCSPTQRRLFDPTRYCVTLFDQRGCGRSTPHAALEANTTWDLVADIERLRKGFGHDRWVVFGGSWGSTLALAYAETHPERVRGLIVRGVFTATPAEIDWYYQGGAAWLFPDLWERFLAPIPLAEQNDLVAAYRRRLTGDDETARLEAAKAWSLWEAGTITLLPNNLAPQFGEARYALAFARIENHYFTHRSWLEDDQLIRDAGRLAGIPGVIVQGRYDVATPMRAAWRLAKAWPDAQLQVIGDAGHAFDEPGILDALIRASDQFGG